MTTPTPQPIPDWTVYTDADLQALAGAVRAERVRRTTLAEGPGQLVDLAARYQAALGTDPQPVAWDAGVSYGPGSVVTYNGGTYRNSTGGVLDGRYVPDDALHPYWTLIPQSGTATPWAAGMALTQGQYVSNGGQIWQYLGADTSSAPANWAPTVANATWALIGPA